MYTKAFVFLTGMAASLALPAQEAAKPIQDNSFLVEEAYNQEAGVVQHISAFTRYRESKDWLYTFTQEWPVPGITHQLSYTLPLAGLQIVPGISVPSAWAPARASGPSSST
jgi:hypothetical protein